MEGILPLGNDGLRQPSSPRLPALEAGRGSRPDLLDRNVHGRDHVDLVLSLGSSLRACVDICGQVDGESLIEDGGLDRHGIYYYVPGILSRFPMAEIDALIAPRPHLAIAGDFDPLTPAAGLDRIDRDLAARYAEAGRREDWRLDRLPCGHEETAEGRRRVLDFLVERVAGRRE